jgi:hypothetical protein
MPYTYAHEEVVVLDATQRGLINLLFQSTWNGPPANVTGATIRNQAGGDVRIIEVTGEKVLANETLLPDPPVEIVSTDGNSFTIQLTQRGQLNPGQITQLNNFIASVWPGAVTDVEQLDFLRVLDEAQAWQMRATLRGSLPAATADDLPKGKRFRVKTKT